MCDPTPLETVDSWSKGLLVLNKLIDLLPFGQVLSPAQYSELISCDLPRIASAAQEQLLYWHLAQATAPNNHPFKTLLLWNNDDYLWFCHIANREEEIVEQVQQGVHYRYLEKFCLSHSQIEIDIQDLCLATTPEGLCIVTAEGKELTYKWNDSTWTTTRENPDQRLVDPTVYYYPPSEPTDVEILEFATARRQAEVSEEALPLSSPPSPTPTNPADGWGDDTSPQWGSRTVCWCSKEVCDCRYRPNTPPTPPSIVLWAPGQMYLPSH